MTLHINFLVIETLVRFSGVSEFLETVEGAIPLLELKARSDLTRMAAQGEWEYSEYDMEQKILDERFGSSVPAFAAYSVIILLHSIVETQLLALAEYLGKNRESKLRVCDMRGKGIEQSALYLDSVLSVPVQQEPAWSCIKDLQKIRNIIVHCGGKLTNEQRAKHLPELMKRHLQELELRKLDGLHEQMWISMDLCRVFARQAKEFFEHVFTSVGLLNENKQLDSPPTV